MGRGGEIKLAVRVDGVRRHGGARWKASYVIDAYQIYLYNIIIRVVCNNLKNMENRMHIYFRDYLSTLEVIFQRLFSL